MSFSIASQHSQVLGFQKSSEQAEPAFIFSSELVKKVVFKPSPVDKGILMRLGRWRYELLSGPVDGRPVDELLIRDRVRNPQLILQDGPQLVPGLPLVVSKPRPGLSLLVPLVLHGCGRGIGQGDAEEEGGVQAGADRALHHGQRRLDGSDIVDNH